MTYTTARTATQSYFHQIVPQRGAMRKSSFDFSTDRRVRYLFEREKKKREF
jgi:hypothetical protein